MGKEKKTAENISKSRPNKSVNDGVEHVNQKVIADERFASAKSDPRFQTLRKKQAKVKIDSRFDKIFTEKEFSSKAALDKRGKKTERKQENADLKHYYQKSEESESQSESEEEEPDGSGEGTESESSTDDDMALVFEDDVPEIEVEDVPLVEEGTRRLAVVNMDWRHVQAVDLFVLLRSCLPKDGDILSVSVYPSEFGLQRMKEEDVRGPVGLFDGENEKDREGSDDDDEIDYEKVRDYEKSRLGYYYGVVECDSVSTADHIYKTCDGTELERSSNVLDLRFIPDSMVFKHPPRDVATEAPAKYEGLDFNTKALQHSNIDISWDEDDPRRTKTFTRHLNGDELAELDMKEYVADDSDTDEEDNDDSAEDKSEKKKSELEKKKNTYLALIQSGDGSDGDDKDKFQDMEVTFNTELEDVSKRILEKKNKESKSVWDEYQRKKREKKKSRNKKSQDSSDDYSSDGYAGKEEAEDDFFADEPSSEKVPKIDARRKGGKKGKSSADVHEEAQATTAELELLVDNDYGLRGYNLKPKKMKGKKGKEIVDDGKIPSVDLNDQRFSKVFSSPLFALDPTDPQYKRSAAYARQISQKQRKEDPQESREEESPHQPTRGGLLSGHLDTEVHIPNSDVVPLRREKHELASLVKSIKRNSQQVQLSSKDQLSKKRKAMLPGISEKTESPDLGNAQTQRKTNPEKKNKKAAKKQAAVVPRRRT